MNKVLTGLEQTALLEQRDLEIIAEAKEKYIKEQVEKALKEILEQIIDYLNKEEK